MNMQSFFALRLKQNNLRRGDIPSLLGSQNSNKFLRRFDAFLAGNFSDVDMLCRIRNCPTFADIEFENILQMEILQKEINHQEYLRLAEIKARNFFVPHIWTVHEHSVPSPIFIVALGGINRFKRINLPEDFNEHNSIEVLLVDLSSFIISYMENPPLHNVLSTPFGKAITFLFRYEFDRCYVFDIEKKIFTDERFFNWKSISQVTLRIK